MMVARVWRRAGLKPHRLERYMASDDPDFERKAADVIGLYVNPPQHAAVFCVDEKTAIQALDRLDRVLPLSPGRAERHGFEYYRHGTLSLYAALNTKSGQLHPKSPLIHTSCVNLDEESTRCRIQTATNCSMKVRADESGRSVARRQFFFRRGLYFDVDVRRFVVRRRFAARPVETSPQNPHMPVDTDRIKRVLFPFALKRVGL